MPSVPIHASTVSVVRMKGNAGGRVPHHLGPPARGTRAARGSHPQSTSWHCRARSPGATHTPLQGPPPLTAAPPLPLAALSLPQMFLLLPLQQHLQSQYLHFKYSAGPEGQCACHFHRYHSPTEHMTHAHKITCSLSYSHVASSRGRTLRSCVVPLC